MCFCSVFFSFFFSQFGSLGVYLVDGFDAFSIVKEYWGLYVWANASGNKNYIEVQLRVKSTY